MKTHLIIFTLLCAVTALAGDIKNDIIGKWTDQETGQTVEFGGRGGIEQTLPGGEIMRGKYAFFEDTQIYIQFKSELLPISAVVTPISLEGDDLQMIGEDGQKVKKLKRVKDHEKEKDQS